MLIKINDKNIEEGAKITKLGMLKEDFLEEFGFNTYLVGRLSKVNNKRNEYYFRIEKITLGGKISSSILLDENNAKYKKFLEMALIRDFSIKSYKIL